MIANLNCMLGISSMSKGCFLNPHIDNSHDRKIKKFRRLNLLYYVNKNWDPINDGGDLLLFPDGIKNKEVNYHVILID